MANTVEWFEVMGRDANKLRGFYGELFGWKFQMAPDASMDYGMTDKAQTGIGGGVGKAPMGAGWVTFYVSVDDVSAMIARAQKLDAKVLMPATKLPDGMTIAIVTDPEGHPVGLVSSKG
jgi:predicted enzyme related to lactoylglutathione lyase